MTPAARVEAASARIAKLIARVVPDGFYGVVAESLDWSRQRFTKTMSPDPKARVDISLARVACLDAEHAVPLLTAALPPQHAIVQLPAAQTVDASELELVMRAQRETGEVVAKHLESLRDGHMTRAEGVELEREADEAIAILLTVRERARQAQREVVIGMPLRKVGA